MTCGTTYVANTAAMEFRTRGGGTRERQLQKVEEGIGCVREFSLYDLQIWDRWQTEPLRRHTSQRYTSQRHTSQRLTFDLRRIIRKVTCVIGSVSVFHKGILQIFSVPLQQVLHNTRHNCTQTRQKHVFKHFRGHICLNTPEDIRFNTQENTGGASAEQTTHTCSNTPEDTYMCLNKSEDTGVFIYIRKHLYLKKSETTYVLTHVLLNTDNKSVFKHIRRGMCWNTPEDTAETYLNK